ncbi:MAG: endonuclease domain-containing protein [Bacteroidetes bacterium]|nr:endonuclease domain-containing protein [Bacteroidota bacterium]
MSTENNNFYNKSLKNFAHGKRYEMTKAEACLWKFVLSSKKLGYTFNRQRPILNFIVDFMCKDLKLIIEVDGYSHFIEEIISKDEIRQQTLENLGYTVIRFRDSEILNQIDRVRIAILNSIEQIENNKILPLPPPKGDN